MPIIIGVGVVVVVILIAVTTMGGDPPPPPNNPSADNQKKESVEQPKETPKNTKPLPDQSHLKDPDTPAPAIESSALIAADKIYNKAKKLNDDARIAQSKGEGDKFNKLINDSWDLLEGIDEPISKYTEWLENASMEDWKVPASYHQLQLKLNKYDKLRGQIKRIKPNRR